MATSNKKSIMKKVVGKVKKETAAHEKSETPKIEKGEGTNDPETSPVGKYKNLTKK